ncbi:MAG: tetratricopeptide repeat protein [Verrucomicrobiae bacterium]|nr:tetratricopeptide repeat protein [Verrucomicrobiae bacterium]
MKLLSVKRIFLTLFLAFVLPLAVWADEPSELYLNFYLTMQNAEKAESQGDFPTAYARFKTAQDTLLKIKGQYPDWKKEIVDFRLKYIGDALNRLKSKVPESVVNAMPPAVAPSPTPAPTPSVDTSPTASDSDDVSSLKQRISQLESELATTKQELAKANADKASLQTRLEEAEKALAMAKSADFDARVADLLKENSELKSKLATAEEQIRTLGTGGAGTDTAALTEQLAKVRQQLELKERENESFRKATEDLKKQLDDAQKYLSSGSGGQLATENQMLRAIIDRQMKDQARREAAKKLIDEEVQKLQIKSEVLQRQLEIVTSPYEPLSEAEQALFKAPTVAPSDVTSPSAGTEAPPADGSISTELSRLQDSTTTSNRPKVPAALLPLTEEARKAFEAGDFEAAAIKYKEILSKAPENLYALSNLGVVYFQQGKLPEAESNLKKAVAIAPNDAFSYSILGVVYYQKGQFDQAIEALTRSLAIDANNAQAHNYLGIACSRKGWMENAEQEIRKAIEIDPNYAEAHFNLAVIYATQKPPSKALARKHYNQAVSLGIKPDPELDKMIR